MTASPASASDTTTRWESFSEAAACGAAYTSTPYASKKGFLSGSEAVLGPFGTYFGRTITEIAAELVYWTVPGSGGRRVRVHSEMLPSLQRVAARLAGHAQQGRVYPITSVSAHTPRTIGDSYRVSRHAMGLAIDINPSANPYRADNRLITNMPSWFVQSWTSEGFCWGGSWQDTKDPMHFSWMGPAATPTGDSLAPRPPKTSKTSLGGETASHQTLFRGVTDRYRLAIADLTGDGAPDVAGVRPHPSGAVLDVTSSSYSYGDCSVWRWFLADPDIAGADHLVFGDVDGDSGQDLIALLASGSGTTAVIGDRYGRFETLAAQPTAVGADAVAVAAGDFDGDHRADLWEATPGGRLRVWRGPGFTELIADDALPGGAPVSMVVGDRDGRNRPELFALSESGEVSVLTRGSGWSVETSRALSTPKVLAIGAGDYDGDGRADLQVLDDGGRLAAHVLNTSTGIPPGRWFRSPEPECTGDEVPLSFDGPFYDDDGSLFEDHIESIADVGVTRGCNPPFNDAYCPKDLVTREMMAAFLVRALGLTGDHPGFDDVAPDNIFAGDIGRLAAAGITKGCNPPANNLFCPRDPVTREMMAAFLDRAGLGS